jgi:hypothetical protein
LGAALGAAFGAAEYLYSGREFCKATIGKFVVSPFPALSQGPCSRKFLQSRIVDSSSVNCEKHSHRETWWWKFVIVCLWISVTIPTPKGLVCGKAVWFRPYPEARLERQTPGMGDLRQLVANMWDVFDASSVAEQAPNESTAHLPLSGPPALTTTHSSSPNPVSPEGWVIEYSSQNEENDEGTNHSGHGNPNQILEWNFPGRPTGPGFEANAFHAGWPAQEANFTGVPEPIAPGETFWGNPPQILCENNQQENGGPGNEILCITNERSCAPVSVIASGEHTPGPNPEALVQQWAQYPGRQ